MLIEKSKFISNTSITKNTYLIKVFSPSIAKTAKPGQFCNIKVSENSFPLLRRPFSICDVEGDYLYFMFDVHGEGTRLLRDKNEGEELDIIGPLGIGFDLIGDYDTAIFIAGGLGSAPFPFLSKNIPAMIEIHSFIGGRSKENVIEYKMKNVSAATDDGSYGFQGNVVELFINKLTAYNTKKIRVFACGPNPMLKALQNVCNEKNINCQLSVETVMACGFGICQGCPIEKYNGDGYFLVCKDGPVFNSLAVKI
ncbi:MAG: dihydroorotate dehydrogenase electron transfer subunit [Melioribacteraceae bacterium]|nr:dihydroorotate dehydrogenase electron transfer subunit [Melioribacteraceae bacterium]